MLDVAWDTHELDESRGRESSEVEQASHSLRQRHILHPIERAIPTQRYDIPMSCRHKMVILVTESSSHPMPQALNP